MHFHIFTTIRSLSVAFFLILFSISINAQSGVKIKEHVTIAPIQKPLSNIPPSGIFSIGFHYYGALKEGTSPWLEMIINDAEPCSTRVFGSSGPLMTGIYNTWMIYSPITNDSTTVTYSVDDQEFYRNTTLITNAPCEARINDYILFSESFKLHPDSVFLKPGGWEDALVYPVGTNCQTDVGWSDYYPTTWSVVQGAKWGSFYNGNDDSLGAIYTSSLHSLNLKNGIGFRLAANIPDSISCVIIKAECNGIEKYKKIYPWKELDHFKVIIIPDTVSAEDTVAFTEGATLKIQAKDINDKDIIIDANTLLKLSLLSNTDYGTFIDVKGDTLKTTPVQLSSILYSDAYAGKIKFAAVKRNPESLVACKIHVEKQGYPEKFGERDAIVVEQTLKIVMDTPYEVRPSIPTEDGNQSMIASRKKPFEVRITRGGKPVANHPFRLWTNYIDYTGGHSHDNTTNVRRVDNDDNFGYFTVGQVTTHRRPLIDVTDANGGFIVTYNASIFGDNLKIYLKSRDLKKEKFFQDSITITEKVDNLQRFNDGVEYDLVGGTPAHHGPPGYADDENHWCTQQTADSLQLSIRQFNNWSRSKRETPVIVLINDMSLRLGGRFDISGCWEGRNSQAHLYHRTGGSVDINRGGMSERQLNRLTDFINRHQGIRDPERPRIHYGFNGEY